MTIVGPAGPAAATEDYPAPADGTFRLTGHGNGHGIGLSQYGARNAATLGRSGTQILDFYYPGTTHGRGAGELADPGAADGRVASEVPVQGATALAVRDAATGQGDALPDASAR
jgi:hypothetical protein